MQCQEDVCVQRLGKQGERGEKLRLLMASDRNRVKGQYREVCPKQGCLPRPDPGP